MRMKSNPMRKIMKRMSKILQEPQAKFQLDHFYLTRKIKIKKYQDKFRKINKLILKSKAQNCIMET